MHIHTPFTTLYRSHPSKSIPAITFSVHVHNNGRELLCTQVRYNHTSALPSVVQHMWSNMNNYGQIHICALWIPSSYLCPGQVPINQGHLDEDQKNLCGTAKRSRSTWPYTAELWEAYFSLYSFFITPPNFQQMLTLFTLIPEVWITPKRSKSREQRILKQCRRLN